MRKITLIFTVLLSVAALAQEGPLISSAVLAERNGDLEKAKEYIDEAESVISNKSEEELKYKTVRKFLYYKGLVNYRIATKNPENTDEEALAKAKEGFSEVIAYEEKIGKKSYTSEAQGYLPNIAQEYANIGINYANAQEFEKAYDAFLTTYELKKAPGIGQIDTSMYFNAGLMAQNAKNYVDAIRINKELLEMGYKGTTFTATSVETGEEMQFASKSQMQTQEKLGLVKDPKIEGDVRSDMYASLANLYLASGDSVEYKEVIKEGRKQFPENEALLRLELQGFLDAKQYDKALVNLNQAIAGAPNDPSSKLFYYIKGFILQTNVEDDDAALEAYGKAAELDPEYLEPRYMSGLIYVEKGNAIATEMNNLPLNAKSKYEKLKKDQVVAFENALPFFEASYAINPKDKETLSALNEVYRKLKMYEKAKKTQSELDSL